MTLTAQNRGVLLGTGSKRDQEPGFWRDQTSQFYTPRQDDEHPRLFHMEVPPGIDTTPESVQL